MHFLYLWAVELEMDSMSHTGLRAHRFNVCPHKSVRIAGLSRGLAGHLGKLDFTGEQGTEGGDSASSCCGLAQREAHAGELEQAIALVY